MNLKLNWPEYKTFITSKNLSVQGIEKDDYYCLTAADDFFVVECNLYKYPTDTTDLDDFLTNYKSTWNRILKPFDHEGNPVVKNLLAGKDQYYKPRIMSFSLGKYKSLVNINSQLSDIGDCEIKFFDGSLIELTIGESESEEDFQTRLNANCRFTWIYYTPTKNYKAKVGMIMCSDTPTNPTFAWFEQVPHIPKVYGGSIACIDGGIPLHLFREKSWLTMDGGACADVMIDEVNYTHRVGVKVYHALAENTNIVVLFGIYHAL